MGKKNEKFTDTIENVLEVAQGLHGDLTDSIRESADSFGENFPGSERTEMYETAADILESLDLNYDVPAEIAEVVLTYEMDTRANRPKRVQVQNLTSILRALHEAAFDENVDDDDDIAHFVDGMEQAAEEAEQIEL